MKNPNLDFAAFASRIIKAVDDIRSFGGATTSTPTTSSNRPTESRINAFYRLLGLPAAILSEKESAQDSFNTGNKFKGSELGFSDSQLNIEALKRENGFLEPVTSVEARNFVHNNTHKIDDGIQDSRSRGSLFPLIVFGEVPVFPQDRRVADAFLEKEDLKVEDTDYKRPFIEAVIYIRLKGAGTSDPQLQQQLEEDFNITGSSLNVLEANMIRALATASNTVIERIARAVALINEAAKELSAHQLPSANLVAEARQEFANDADTIKAGAIEKRQARQVARESVQSSFLFTLEFENDGTNNLKDIALVSDLLSLIGNQDSGSGRRNEVITVDAKNKKELQLVLEKAQKKARRAFRELEFLLGTFSGLSGVDVAVIIEALFEITIDELVGLLNNEAKERLNAIKGGNINTNTSVGSSLQALEAKIKEIYARILGGADARKHKEKLSNRRE